MPTDMQGVGLTQPPGGAISRECQAWRPLKSHVPGCVSQVCQPGVQPNVGLSVPHLPATAANCSLQSNPMRIVTYNCPVSCAENNNKMMSGARCTAPVCRTCERYHKDGALKHGARPCAAAAPTCQAALASSSNHPSVQQRKTTSGNRKMQQTVAECCMYGTHPFAEP